jgi:hypothetical protein
MGRLRCRDGIGWEAMDRIFAEGMADVAQQGWSAPAAKTAAATMRPPLLTSLPRLSFTFVGGGGGGGGVPGSDATAHRRSPRLSIATSLPMRGMR